jgi:hypothetical protein
MDGGSVLIDDSDWAVPVLASVKMREALQSSVRYADIYFTVETRRLRKLYIRSGKPHLAYQCGRGLSELGLELGIQNSIGLGVFEITLAEMLIGGGVSSLDLDRAELHLLRGRRQVEHSQHNSLASRVFGQWYMIMAVSLKARGKLEAYEEFMRSAVSDSWLIANGTPGDRVPLVRQYVMMRQSLNEHIALLYRAHEYKRERPLEYYRTLKRVVEFLVNKGLSESAQQLEKELTLSFLASSDKMPLLGKVSFARDMAQLLALKGETQEGAKLAATALKRAQEAELLGQVRQLKAIRTAIESGNVLGALKQFYV